MEFQRFTRLYHSLDIFIVRSLKRKLTGDVSSSFPKTALEGNLVLFGYAIDRFSVERCRMIQCVLREEEEEDNSLVRTESKVIYQCVKKNIVGDKEFQLIDGLRKDLSESLLPSLIRSKRDEDPSIENRSSGNLLNNRPRCSITLLSNAIQFLQGPEENLLGCGVRCSSLRIER